ncbi:MAG: RNB domain-containing ribonuclease [Candidatus Handelsmanbacteria bacterium]|nr:RNB domain-containing ribonuclease [Candidatus Handelsmanbacteria bacterium]
MQTIPADSLVLYKNRPARVRSAGDRLDLELEDGRSQKVRPKDAVLLHPGPLRGLGELQPPQGEVETAWELLAGNAAPLAEVSELVFGDFTPATAWATWQLVADGLYFRGTPDAVRACALAEVEAERASRRAREEQERAWEDFVARVRARQVLPADRRLLAETEQLALGRQPGSRLLRQLGSGETDENAHALLLELGCWDHTLNPHPRRLDLPIHPPHLGVPSVRQEPRLDLTHLPAFAIDDEGNQDPDDALSIEGGRLWVHVADVAALVEPDSPIDLEARARGANLYLPEGVVPMLPPQVTQQLGLGLAETSPALSFGLDLSPAGEVVGLTIAPSLVRVTRLTYEEVDQRIVEEPFQTFHRLALASQARRRARGALFIDLPELKIRVEQGQVSIKPLPSLPSRDLVTEAMLMAGAAAARFALDEQLPFPFSTQDPPEEREPLPSAEGLAGMFAQRRTLRRSQLKSAHSPHAGLGLKAYAQATSPLRRYLDLVVHQQLRAQVRGDRTLAADQLLARVGAAQAVTGAVRQAERLSNRHWTLVFLMERIGSWWEGILVDRRDRRSILIIPALALELSAHLPADPPLNSSVSLELRGVDLPRLEAHFQPA